MSYLLDTCVLSEYKKPTPAASVIAWLDSQPDEMLFLSVLTIGELEKGIHRMPKSKRKADLAAFLESLLNRFDRRILALDTPTMRAWGRLIAALEEKGTPMPLLDSQIAATAIHHHLTLVTRNVSDFANTAIRIHNPWE